MDQNETKHWADTGCEVSASCLECHLPACKWDDPYAYQRYKKLQKDRAIAEEIRAYGLTASEASARHGITIRTVFRIKERAKKELSVA